MESDLEYVDVSKLKVLPGLEIRNYERGYLKESAKKHGIMAPLVVARLPNGEEYVMDGIGRVITAIQRGEKKLPARVIKCKDLTEAVLLAIELNTAVQPLSFREIVEIVKFLMKNGVDKKTIREQLSLSRQKMHRICTLLSLPEKLQEEFFENNFPENILDVIHKHQEELTEEDLSYIFSQLKNAKNKLNTCRKLIEQILEAKAIAEREAEEKREGEEEAEERREEGEIEELMREIDQVEIPETVMADRAEFQVPEEKVEEILDNRDRLLRIIAALAFDLARGAENVPSEEAVDALVAKMPLKPNEERCVRGYISELRRVILRALERKDTDTLSMSTLDLVMRI